MTRTLLKYILTTCILTLFAPVFNRWNVAIAQTFKHSQGVTSTMGTPPEGLMTGYKTKADDPRLADGVTLQRAHEYVHNIYIRPGESTILEPFSDFHSANESTWGYKYTYNRWYDYRTDNISSRLSSPGGNYQSVAFAGKGHWGGSALSGLGVEHRYSGSRINYQAPNNNDSIFDIIAIEVSNSATSSIYNSTSKTLTEPTLQYRHIFVIHNALKLADDMTSSADANKKYIEKTRIKLMCPAGTPFQYPLPEYEYRGWGDKAKPTGFYYKTGDNKYSPVYHYRIEILDATTGTVIGSTTDSYAYDKDGTTTKGSKLGKANSASDSDEATLCGKFQGNLVYSYKCIDGYDRVMYLKKPEVGKYIIRIYAVTTSSNSSDYTSIKIINSNQNLLLQEYELEVLPATEASMITESTLNGNADYEHQRPAVMRELYGDPTVRINFDEITSNQTTELKNGAYYKWPREWENSSYGFGYTERYDYNMYVVANHSDCLPYIGAVQLNTNSMYNKVLHDRLYFDTNKKSSGFFYYANAASDPTRMALLDVEKDICINTRIYMSAWVCEVNNNNETANLVFSFRGVKEDGSEVVLNSFVTGYIMGGMNTATGFYNSNDKTKRGNRGEWMHIYYSFIPNVKDGDNKFDHYIISLENNCTSSQGADYAVDDIECYVRKLAIEARQEKPLCMNNYNTELSCSVDFSQLINAFLIPEADNATNGKEDSLYYCYLAKPKFQSVYAKTNNYKAAFDSALIRNSYNDGFETYGVMRFNSHFESNEQRKQVGASRRLLFSTHIVDSLMRYNGTYMLALTNPDLVQAAPDAFDFDILNDCSYVSEFEVVFSGEITIDGAVSKTLAGVEVCANQKPLVQIDLNSINQYADTVQHIKKAYFDWFRGSISDYEGAEYNGQPLVNALLEFRTAYPTAIQSEFETKKTTTRYTGAMKDCIRHFMDNGKLKLYLNNSYIDLADQYEDIMIAGEKREYYLTAIPINPNPDNQDFKYCLDPMEIVAHLTADVPTMLDGDDHDVIPYPAAMKDVPLRIGLKQLNKCSNLKTVGTTGNISTPAGKMLHVPLREIRPVTEGVTKLKKSKADDYVYLVTTDDPAAVPENGLKSVGRVSSITASKDDTENVCAMAFLEDINFREGYQYTLLFHFDEDNPDATANVCSGDVIMTLKIVPEYQMWTGAVSRNWNDDRNWRRVTRAELFNPTTDNVGNDFVTDGGKNDNTGSFVPADFTKVIIPAGGTIPYMYNLHQKDNLKKVRFASYGESYYIASMATYNDEIADVPKIQYNPEVEEYAGISEDMSSVDIENGVACRPWYDHTCEQIHFMSGAEMMDQRYLYYRKAWVDLELDPARWHTVSLPLINVVAGDFYAPTDGARQDTPLFQDISYNTELNDRFAPAVFQRSWNAAHAKVVNLDGSTDDSAVKLDWSFVYNDVNVSYNSGIGFSVKPDVSRLPQNKRPEKVKFRFPKADVSYSYFNPGNADGGNTEDVRTTALDNGKRVGRLIDITSDYEVELGNYSDKSTYFLVGNPFVCHLNMKEFFKLNDGLKPQYWIVTANGQQAAVMSSDTDGFVSTINDASAVAPGVSFFVEVKEGTASNYTVRFTSGMMTYPKKEDNMNNGQLQISARDGTGFTTSLILTDGVACKTSGAETLFDSNLSDKPMLYATVGGQAMTISEITRESRIPIGLAGNDGEMELCFDNAPTFDVPLYVFDAQTGRSQPLTSSTVTLSQKGSGVRYYIVTESQMSAQAATLPSILIDKNRMKVEISGTYENAQVSVFSPAGNCIAHAPVNAGQCEIPLESGAYAVRVRYNDSEYGYKISIP